MIDMRRLKEKGVYSYNCNKLNKTNMLLANILNIERVQKIINSGISTASIDTSRPSRDPYRSFKSQH